MGFSSGDGDGEASHEQNILGTVLDQMNENMEAMQMMFTQADAGRAMVDDGLRGLSESLNQLTARIEANAPSNDALLRVAGGQEKLLEVLRNIENSEAADAESRMRLRSIDVQLLHLTEEMAAGRQESTVALRAEINALSAAILHASASRPSGDGGSTSSDDKG